MSRQRRVEFWSQNGWVLPSLAHVDEGVIGRDGLVAGSPNIKFGDFQAVARAPGSLRRWESDGEERVDEGKEPEQHGLCEAIACSAGPTTRECEVDGGGYWLRRI